MHSRRTNSPPGFTLLELVIVIALTATVMVVVFSALARVNTNEERFQRKRDEEKDIYLLSHRLSHLFKSLSSLRVTDNHRRINDYFRGTRNNAIFMSRSPLLSPYNGLYFVELLFRRRTLFYREKHFRQEGKFITFNEMSKERFIPLLTDVERLEIQYLVWDEKGGDFFWRRKVNTFNGDPLPLKSMVRLNYRGQRHEIILHRIIVDKDEKIPPEVFE